MSTSVRAQHATASELLLDRQHMPYELDGGVGARASIGVVVLSSDYTIEYEFRQILNLPGVALYHGRIENDADINPATLAAMEGRIARATSLIAPGVALDVVVYGCTSGSMVIGEERVHARIHEVRPGVACTTPMEAVFAALRALGVGRVALIAPYLDRINRSMRAHVLANGFEVPVMGSWNIPNDNIVARLSADTVRRAVLELGAQDTVDAVFVSCTSVRLAEQAQALEHELGKPVISSNLATAWHCLRLAGIGDRVPGFGALFAAPAG